MQSTLYVQQQGHGEVRQHRFGEWIEAEWAGRRFHFRLRPMKVGGLDRLLVRFRTPAVCQQALLRVEGERISFKSAHTVAAQRFEPRRTAIESLGVREGDLLVGSDVWSVDYLLGERHARGASFVLRALPDGLVVAACGEATLAAPADGEETAVPAASPLRLLAADRLRSAEPVSATFVADSVLYELSNERLGDERADLRFAAVGYLLAPRQSRITLGGSDEHTVPLYADDRRRPAADDGTWNLWFEALRCRAEPGTVVSAVALGPESGEPTLDEALQAYLRPPGAGSAADESAADESVRAEPVEASAALVNKSFVLNKCEEVFALAGSRPELQREVRRLRALLGQGDYHQASLLAEQLRQEASVREPEASAGRLLEHGSRFRVGGSELVFLDRGRLAQQAAPDPRGHPGLLLLAQPVELGRLRHDAAQLWVHPAGAAGPARCSELRLGRRDPDQDGPETAEAFGWSMPASPSGAAKLCLPPGNLGVSSRAGRLFVEAGRLCAGPWRRSLFEGDALVLGFQMTLEHPEDRSPVGPGDTILCGPLLLELGEAGEWIELRLVGLLLDGRGAAVLGAPDGTGRLDLPLPGAAEPVLVAWRSGVRLTLGDAQPDGAHARVGPYRLEHSAGGRAEILVRGSSGGALLRFGRAEAGTLFYSTRKRVTRVRHAPLYPVTDELFVGLGWQSERQGAGVELLQERQAATYFRIGVRRVAGDFELYCQASAARSGTGGVAMHLRDGQPSPDDRLLAGDELSCSPARFRVVQALDAEGMELDLELAAVELPAEHGGWLAGLDAELPDEDWALRLPYPFPRSARVRWSALGQFELRGGTLLAEQAVPELRPKHEPVFQLFDRETLESRALRIGGLGSGAEIVHAALEAGLVVAAIETSGAEHRLRPLGDAELWLIVGSERVEPVPAQGVRLDEGCRFGVGQAALRYESIVQDAHA
jgi:hypothetical protein